ncbi:gamma-glutamylcyclotransferase [Dongia sp.]|uniref:gamma-glutamylcyclotransferase n=1 Tax=Dongia sp. TaxID=1977262 RepID=UPI0035B16952
MTLTPDLVAKVHRVVADAGPDPSQHYHDDADYAAITQAMLAMHPPGTPCWIFAYGSLIWKPEVPHVAEMRGLARGYHRAFCFRVKRFRGTQEQPGLMMGLDNGGQCTGLLLRLPDEDLSGHVNKLFRREFTMKPATCPPRWIKVATEEGPVRAIAFVINRQARNYAGRLSVEEVAEILSTACGHWGSGAEYLHNTVAHLETRGIHDRHLWHLQQLVAERIKARG